MKVYLIRHGMTKGNEEKRYVGGRTDEHISREGMFFFFIYIIFIKPYSAR